MRKVVLMMMTTLNGRLDDPDAWMAGVSEDQYQEIDRRYGEFDTILVGRVTADEMYEYWPTADAEEGASESQKSMARRMHTYQKCVFTRDGGLVLPWHNAEPVVATSDDQVRDVVAALKAQAGKDILLAGGAALAQALIRLDLVDEFRLFVYPVYSPGECWFGGLAKQVQMELTGSRAFTNGVVASYCRLTR